MQSRILHTGRSGIQIVHHLELVFHVEAVHTVFGHAGNGIETVDGSLCLGHIGCGVDLAQEHIAHRGVEQQFLVGCVQVVNAFHVICNRFSQLRGQVILHVQSVVQQCLILFIHRYLHVLQHGSAEFTFLDFVQNEILDGHGQAFVLVFDSLIEFPGGESLLLLFGGGTIGDIVFDFVIAARCEPSAVQRLQRPAVTPELTSGLIQREEAQIVILAVVDDALLEILPTIIIADGNVGTGRLGQHVLLQEFCTLGLDFLIIGILVIVRGIVRNDLNLIDGIFGHVHVG